MKINHKIEINIYEFIKNGKFDYIKIGQTREWILNNFPDPDDFKEEERQNNIFYYGDFEFHFIDDKLFLIFADFTEIIKEGDSLAFSQKWIFKNKASSLKLNYVIRELLNCDVDFSVTKNKYSSSITIKTSGNTELLFEAEHKGMNPSEYVFRALYIKGK